MVLTLNLMSLISRKALVPFEFDARLRAAPRKAVDRDYRDMERLNDGKQFTHRLGGRKIIAANERRELSCRCFNLRQLSSHKRGGSV